MTRLFEPFTQKGMTLRNRIVMAPMCQYSSGADAVPTPWHLVHLGARATGGVGLVIVEATAVESRGRISEGDLGLWNQDQAAGFQPIVRYVKSQGAAMGIQLGHAGRKAWSSSKAKGPEQPIAPSAVPWDEDWVTPTEMTAADIDAVVAAFKHSATLARDLGFDMIELHGAHGYLMHQFHSPISNRRTDEYGGSLENRLRLHKRVIQAVQSVWPEDRPLWIRFSCTDWLPGGLDTEEIVESARLMKQWGIDLIDCSSGGVAPAKVPVGPGYQIPYAEAIRKGAGIATGAVGLVTSPELAEEIVHNGRADVVLLARELLRHPYWPLEAAKALHAEHQWPVQYLRAK